MNTEPDDFESLHPNARWAMRLSHALVFFVPVAGPSAALLAAADGLGPPLLRATLWIVLAVSAAVLGWTLGGARWHRTRFLLDGDALRIRRGLFWRSETLVPRSRVQHTDVNRSPLDRRLGLASLKVYTAGTRLAHVSLEGLPAERAVELRDALVAADADVL